MNAVRTTPIRSRVTLRSAGMAFFALFFLVLQPVCAAYERYIGPVSVAASGISNEAADAGDALHGSRDGAPCCSELHADAMQSASPAPADKSFAAAALTVASPFAFPASPDLKSSYRLARGIPPPQPLSYYARSARIQR